MLKTAIDDCSICQACLEACPKNAITLSNEVNFCKYPAVDPELCVNCGICNKVCPASADLAGRKHDDPICYVAYSRDEKVRFVSSSGGIFNEIAEYVLRNEGVVCGAAFDGNFDVRHIFIEKTEDLPLLRGSKYAQSDMNGCYGKTKQFLQSGKLVLFSGCPCQIEGLFQYLGGKKYENLLAVELICHGIPSREMFADYRQYLSDKYHSKIVNVQFRSKETGWLNSSLQIDFENGKSYRNPIVLDPYIKGYFGGVTFKEACYRCRYKLDHTLSDIIIGDFWGAEVECPEFNDNKGLSTVVLNTAKGSCVFDHLDVVKRETSLDIILKYNKNLVKPTDRNPMQTAFLQYAGQYGFSRASQHFFGENLLQKAYRIARYRAKCIYYCLSHKGKPCY